MVINPHARLRSETVSLTLRLGRGQHKLDASLAYDVGGILREVAFVGRGKVGHGLDQMLHELGIQLSRAIQGRDPDTGAAPVSPPQTMSAVQKS
jgi:hypothetical protein